MTTTTNPTIIYGSNSEGWHGAGAAGLVFRGNPDLHWRTCPVIKAARAHGPGYKGKKAVWLQPSGYQEGTEGSSYGIITVTRPGMRRSIPLSEIMDQVVELCKFIRDNPDKQFEMTPFGAGYAGYMPREMAHIWKCPLAYPNVEWSPQTSQEIQNRTRE